MPKPTINTYSKKRFPLWGWIILALVGAILLVSLWIGLQISQQTKLLSQLPSNDWSPISTHLMPRFEEVYFQEEQSGLTLSGWIFRPDQQSRGNLLIIHSNRSNRMPFGLETANLVSALVEEGFTVMTFDQRHSGRSEGEASAYGMAEYKDVRAALQCLGRQTRQKNVILYGIGSGCSSALLAWNTLPTQMPEDIAGTAEEDAFFLRSDISAVLLDSPVASLYDYVRADLNPKGWLNQKVFRPAIPKALRLSNGNPEPVNLVPLVTQIQSPIWITLNRPDTRLDNESLQSLIDERTRLHPTTTTVFEVSEAGHIEAYLKKPEDYIGSLTSFLNRWFE